MKKTMECISYKQAKKLAKLISEKDNMYYVAKHISLQDFNENIISNLLFDYRLLAFVQTKDGQENVIIYQLPKIEEQDNLKLIIASEFDPEFLIETIDYIKEEYEDFEWKKIIVEYLVDETEIDGCVEDINKIGGAGKVIFPLSNQLVRCIGYVEL